MKPIWQQLLQRPANSHKYDYGHVLVIGGSPGMVGAPLLAAQAALRIGAGLVTIASTAEVINKLEKRVVEVMTVRLTDGAAQLLPYITDRQVSVIVVGPGLQPALAKVALKQLKNINLPVIIDGGALATLAEEPQLIKPDVILTPHLGEFRRFIKTAPTDPVKAAADFAQRYRVTVVLKGHPAYICSAGGQVYQNHSGGPALATAGTGDVLAGMIAGVIAQKISPLAAAKAAVYLHGKAGEIAAGAKTAPGVIASDVIEAIPASLKLVQTEEI